MGPAHEDASSELSFWCGNRPSENHCTTLRQGTGQQGHFSWGRHPQGRLQLKSAELGAAPFAACRLSAKPVLFQGAQPGRHSLQRHIPSSQGGLMRSSKAVEWGNGSLGTSRRVCVLHFQTHLQEKSRKNFLLDAVEFGGLRRRQSFVCKMRVDVHLSHLLVLLCFVLAEIKESFQQVQVEVVQRDNSDPGHNTEQAWKTMCSL